MENWNPNAFYNALVKATEENTFHLEPKATAKKYRKKTITKEDVCEYLSEQIGYEPETIKKWSNYSSKGPQKRKDRSCIGEIIECQTLRAYLLKSIRSI